MPTTQLPRVVATWLMSVGVSVVYELVLFSSPGLQNYPLITSFSAWLTRQLLIGLVITGLVVVLEWVWSQKKIEAIYEKSRVIFLGLLVIGSFIYLHLVHIVPAHVQGGLLRIGCQGLSCLMRFLTYPMGILISGLLIAIIWFIYREIEFKALRWLGAGVGVVIVVLLVGQAAWQQHLAQIIPLQLPIVRTKVLQIAAGKPLVILAYQRDQKPGLENEQQVIFKNKVDLQPFYSVSPRLTAAQWAATCGQYKSSSFGLNVLGAGAADLCYYMGAEIYKQGDMCEATRYSKTCRADVAVEAKDKAICQKDPLCLNQPSLP